MDTTLPDTVLRYERDAPSWFHGIPVGNGRAGAMIWGDHNRQVFSLNDETFWSPGPSRRLFDVPEDALATIRRQLLDGDVLTAQSAADRLMGTPIEGSAFQPLGDLALLSSAGVPASSRRLDMASGIAEFRWSKGLSDQYTQRTVLASRSPSGFLIRHESTVPARVAVCFESPFLDDLAVSTSGLFGTGTWRETSPNRDVAAASYRLKNFPGRHLRFVVGVAVLSGSSELVDGKLALLGPEWELAVAVATDFACDDPQTLVSTRLAEFRSSSVGSITRLAEQEHRAIFSRARVRLARADATVDAALEAAATDARVHGVRAGGLDDGLLQQTADFGKYLLIASTVGGRYPPTLQGVWNWDTEPAWSSNWTTNINAQMNLWAAGPLQIPEALDSLLSWLEEVAANGQRTAQKVYGAGRTAWVVHHNTDIWFNTAPTTMFEVGIFPAAGLWLSTQAFHMASRFPGRIDPHRLLALLRGCADFLDTWLVRDNQGRLVPVPSSAPENAYLLPGVDRPRNRAVDPDHRRHGWLGVASAIDLWLIRETYESLLAVAQDVGSIDADDQAHWHAQLRDLAPVPVIDGRIPDWLDHDAPLELGHRHFSALFGVFPGEGQASLTPEIREAAICTLVRQISQVEFDSVGFGGWSRVWVAALWARLGHGDRALASLESLLRTGIAPGSLLHVVPPFDHEPSPDAIFQIDANLGFSAIVAELVVQSRPGFITVLPALPTRWQAGDASGLRCHGGIDVTLAWRGGRLVSLLLQGDAGAQCEVTASTEGWTERVVLGADGSWSWSSPDCFSKSPSGYASESELAKDLS